MIATGELSHGANHVEDRRHDRTIGQIHDGRRDADADTQQHPEQRHQETGFGQRSGTVLLQVLLLPRNHAARTRSGAVFRACEDIEQLVGTGCRFVAQEPLRHVPAVRGTDLEHLLRQRREFGSRIDQRVEGLLLIARHLRAPLRQRIELLLIERPEFLELLLEIHVRGQADRRGSHRSPSPCCRACRQIRSTGSCANRWRQCRLPHR